MLDVFQYTVCPLARGVTSVEDRCKRLRDPDNVENRGRGIKWYPKRLLLQALPRIFVPPSLPSCAIILDKPMLLVIPISKPPSMKGDLC